MPSNTSDLAIDFFPRVGFATDEARVRAWHEYRVAADALAELSRGWGAPPHALIWSEQDSGWLANGAGPSGTVIGWLNLGAASVWIERREPQEGCWIELEGRPPAEIQEWIRGAATRLSGHHTDGAPTPPTKAALRAFTLDDPDARADLEALYEGAGLLLSALANTFSAGNTEPPPPQLFASTLNAQITLTVREDRAPMTIGLTAPDDAEPLGSWFARVPEGIQPGELPTGRWHESADGAPCARLSIADLTHLEDGESQCERIVSFLNAILNSYAQA